MRILLIEDHADSARALALYLGSEGHDVRVGGSIADAVEACTEGAFDLLVADLVLPDGTGWELLSRVRSRCAAVPAIALTACGGPQDREQSLRAGFNDHLTKPNDLMRLPEIVREIGHRQTVAGA